MMNEETKASLDKFLKEREERIKNMTLAEARDTVSRIYGHSDMRMESDKALQMLLDCADKALEQTRWIPVSDPLNELPKDRMLYVTTELGYVETLVWDMTEWDDADIARSTVAYMNHYEPEPYKPESEDKGDDSE